MAHHRAVSPSLSHEVRATLLKRLQAMRKNGPILERNAQLSRTASGSSTTYHSWAARLFFQASNRMSRTNRVFAVYSRYPGIHAHIHQLNHWFMGTLAGVFLFVGFGCYACKEYHYSSMCGATNDGCSFWPIKYLFKLGTCSRIG